jgi:hypothetical protein
MMCSPTALIGRGRDRGQTQGQRGTTAGFIDAVDRSVARGLYLDTVTLCHSTVRSTLELNFCPGQARRRAIDHDEAMGELASGY